MLACKVYGHSIGIVVRGREFPATMSSSLLATFSMSTVTTRALVSACGRILAAAALCFLLSAVATSAATDHGGRRVALVIGNGVYEHAPKLPNPPKDAGDIAAKLKELGFDVVLGLDLTMPKFGETL